MSQNLVSAFTVLSGKLFGAIRNGKAWLDHTGTERLVRDTPAIKSDGTNTAASADKQNPNYIPDGCVLTNAEAMQVAVHLTDGSVADPNVLWATNAAAIDTSLRNRRDYETMVVTMAKERGLLARIPVSQRAMHDAIERAVAKALAGGDL